MARTVFIVFSNCTDPAREQEFNDWYNDVHLPDILETPHFVAATRYELAGEPREGQGKYLAVYEIDNDDVDAAAAAIRQTIASTHERGRRTDTLQALGGGYYRPIFSLDAHPAEPQS